MTEQATNITLNVKAGSAPTTWQERLIGTGVGSAAFIGFAWGFAYFGLLEGLVSISIIAGFHLLMNWNIATGNSKIRNLRIAGTLDQIQKDLRWTELLLSPTSRIVVLVAGVAKGLLFLAAGDIGFWLLAKFMVMAPVGGTPVPIFALSTACLVIFFITWPTSFSFLKKLTEKRRKLIPAESEENTK